jgi:hypothetical protein
MAENYCHLTLAEALAVAGDMAQNALAAAESMVENARAMSESMHEIADQMTKATLAKVG